MIPLRFDIPADRPLRLLCLGAHADDIEIGAGGTILRVLREYTAVDVHWIVFSATPERRQEATASAEQFLSAAQRSTVQVHDFPDGFFPHHGAEIKRIFEEIKNTVDPDVILTHTRDDHHQDHRTLCELTWNTYRNHLVMEYEILKYDGDLGQPNMFVHLDEATCRRKCEILMEAFASQRDKHWFDEETFMGLARVRGVQAAARGRYAEAFYCRKGVM